jgi:hypothetical protein
VPATPRGCWRLEIWSTATASQARLQPRDGVLDGGAGAAATRSTSRGRQNSWHAIGTAETTPRYRRGHCQVGPERTGLDH